MISRQSNTNQTDWQIIIHEINEDRRKTERRLSIALELAIITLAGLMIWGVAVVIMEIIL